MSTAERATKRLKRWDIAEVRRVRDRQSAAVIDGTLCDLFSTGPVIGVFEGLSAESRDKAQAMPFGTFAAWAWSMVGGSK